MATCNSIRPRSGACPITAVRAPDGSTRIVPVRDVSALDLLKLARAEFAHYERLADGGHSGMFASARLARELLAEAICRMEAAGGAQ